MSVAKTDFQSSETTFPTFHGFSEESKNIQTLIKQKQNHLKIPVLHNTEILELMEFPDFTPIQIPDFAQALSNLKLIFQNCSEENWDGYGASVLKKKAFEDAVKFMKQLPQEFPLPEMVPQPDGDIAMEWELETDHWFIASFPGDGRIDYAGAFGIEARSKGVEKFFETIPDEILKKLYRLFSMEV